MKKRFTRMIARNFRAYWPIGLFAYYALIALSFKNIAPGDLAQLFGLVLVLCGAVAWLVNDYVRESEDRVRSALEDLSDLLAPYDGMKISEMPLEVQEEVWRRLGWTLPDEQKPAKDSASAGESSPEPNADGSSDSSSSQDNAGAPDAPQHRRAEKPSGK